MKFKEYLLNENREKYYQENGKWKKDYIFKFPDLKLVKKFTKDILDEYKKNYKQIDSYKIKGKDVILKFVQQGNVNDTLIDEIHIYYDDYLNTWKREKDFNLSNKQEQKISEILGGLFTTVGFISKREIKFLEYKRYKKFFIIQDKGQKFGGMYIDADNEELLRDFKYHKLNISLDDFEKFLIDNGATKMKRQKRKPDFVYMD